MTQVVNRSNALAYWTVHDSGFTSAANNIQVQIAALRLSIEAFVGEHGDGCRCAFCGRKARKGEAEFLVWQLAGPLWALNCAGAAVESNVILYDQTISEMRGCAHA